MVILLQSFSYKTFFILVYQQGSNTIGPTCAVDQASHKLYCTIIIIIIMDFI